MQELFKIKVCGVTRTEDALFALGAGADAIGLNFFPKSTRYVPIQQGKEIAHAMESLQQEMEKKCWKIGVFVNSTSQHIAGLQRELNLDAIQLHGDESPSLIAEINREIITKNVQIRSDNPLVFIRALRLKPTDYAELVRQTGWVTDEIQAWRAAGVNAFLLDAAAGGSFGGTGKQLNWPALHPLIELAKVPLILAGGLNPGNVRQAIELSGITKIDVASGVEHSPGIKDAEKISEFIENSGLVSV